MHIFTNLKKIYTYFKIFFPHVKKNFIVFSFFSGEVVIGSQKICTDIVCIWNILYSTPVQSHVERNMYVCVYICIKTTQQGFLVNDKPQNVPLCTCRLGDAELGMISFPSPRPFHHPYKNSWLLSLIWKGKCIIYCFVYLMSRRLLILLWKKRENGHQNWEMRFIACFLTETRNPL